MRPTARLLKEHLLGFIISEDKMKFTEKIAKFLKQEKDYTATKCIFNALCMDGGSYFGSNWLEEHMPLMKEIFVKTPNVDIWCNYGKAKHEYSKVQIEDMLLEDGNLKIKIKDEKRGKIKSNINLEFENPSEGCIKIDKGIGNKYSVYLFSRKNSPSQIIFSYFNI